MDIRGRRREEVLERMADYVLAEGLSAATLRPLAAAAGTSDRMLLYYFTDREEVLTATLHRIVQRMIVQLDTSIPMGQPQSFPLLLEKVRAILSAANLRHFMHLWLELASGAARGLQPHRQIAGAIADGFIAWVASRLEDGPSTDRNASAAMLLACIEGLLILEAIGRPHLADSVADQFKRHLGP